MTKPKYLEGTTLCPDCGNPLNWHHAPDCPCDSCMWIREHPPRKEEV